MFPARTCRRCRAPLTRRGTRGPAPTYCGVPCRQAAAREGLATPRPPQQIPARTCAHCATDFTPTDHRQRYCDERCQRHAYRDETRAKHNQQARTRRTVAAVPRAPLTCPQCRMTFAPRTDTQRYCTPQCRTANNRRPEVRVQWPNRVRSEVVLCAVCDAPSNRFAWRPAEQRPTCSTRCRSWLQTGWPLSCQLSDRAATIRTNRRRGVLQSDRVEVLALHEAAGRRCCYCDTVTDDVHADHVVPVWLGGANSLDNLVPACPRVQHLQGAAHPEGLVDTRARPASPRHLRGRRRAMGSPRSRPAELT